MDKYSAAFSCIGDLMVVFGSNVCPYLIFEAFLLSQPLQVMSFMAEICVVTIKTFRSSNVSNPRGHTIELFSNGIASLPCFDIMLSSPCTSR